jgi:hypothetical protein
VAGWGRERLKIKIKRTEAPALLCLLDKKVGRGDREGAQCSIKARLSVDGVRGWAGWCKWLATDFVEGILL